MSIPLFLVFMGIGAASVAIWLDLRFPSLAPTDMRGTFLHMVASMMATQTIVPAVFAATGDSMLGALGAVFGAGFPALVYLFLVGFWMIKLAQRSLSGHFG
jgi:hypothetical protein